MSGLFFVAEKRQERLFARLLFVFIFFAGYVQGHHDRGLRLVNKSWTGRIATPGGGVEFAFPRGDQAQTMADVVHGFIRQRVAVAGACVGVLGNTGEYSPHDTQDAFFSGEFVVIHWDYRLAIDVGVYCIRVLFLYIQGGPIAVGE